MVKELKVALGMRMSANEMRKHNMGIDALNDIQDYLWVYFMRVIQHPKSTAKVIARVDWFMTEDEITDKDLVVYFVANRSGSVIKDLGHSSNHTDVAGLTVLDAPEGAISEVYVENNFPPKKLAHIAFHELMHNKLGKANSMHNIAHLGLGKSPASECSALTNKDKELMALRLNTPVRQYAAGLTGDVSVKFKSKPKRSGVVFRCGNGSTPHAGFLGEKTI